MSNKTHTPKTRTTGTTDSTPILRSVPDHTTAAATAAEDKLREVLHARPNSTATELSAAAKIGKSTAQKILIKWSGDGSVTRTAGIAESGRRAADLWAITKTDVVPDADTRADDTPAREALVDTAASENPAREEPTTQLDPDTTVSDNATSVEEDDPAAAAANSDTVHATDDARNTTDTGATHPADAELAIAELIELEDGPETDSGTATDSGGAEGGDDRKAERLAPGALRGMVEDYLRDHLGEEFSPTAIAKALGGRSSGAVSNALDRLVADGTAAKTKDKPRRFALAPAEQEATPAPVK
jgi:hypothetical protein